MNDTISVQASLDGDELVIRVPLTRLREQMSEAALTYLDRMVASLEIQASPLYIHEKIHPANFVESLTLSGGGARLSLG